jgi:Gamma-glutamyl cyclotransferase, AIG2-like
MRVFFFGSLMDRELLALVTGRAADDLLIDAAIVHGFARRRARDESFPLLVPHPGGRVEGVLVEGLTPADIDRIQFFEGSDYAFSLLAVECRGERLAAHAFLPTARLHAEETAWEFEAWCAAERALCVALTEELMSHYGSLSIAEIDALWPEIKARTSRRFRRRRTVGGRR